METLTKMVSVNAKFHNLRLIKGPMENFDNSYLIIDIFFLYIPLLLSGVNKSNKGLNRFPFSFLYRKYFVKTNRGYSALRKRSE